MPRRWSGPPRWTWAVLALLLGAGLIWTFGPLLPGLEEPAPRLALGAASAALWLGGRAALAGRRRARDAGLAGSVAGPLPDDAAQRRMHAQLAGALALAGRRSPRGSLVEQPWYVIIGPPGAGKTTALRNAGLRFPLTEAAGADPIAGIGGTRSCEWWFTDQAALIDTAGRYTTQDSDRPADAREWHGFLAVLRQARPRQPLNGVIVAVALEELVGRGAGPCLAHARTVRARVAELQAAFDVTLPVYVLFTKADLLAGFVEFFDPFDRRARAQVWGMTFPLSTTLAPAPAPAAAFGAGMRGLLDRLQRMMFDRLQTEPDPGRRALIARFPDQVAGLQPLLGAFLAAAFEPQGAGPQGAGPQDTGPAPLLRGVYLSSATQEGTPVDRLAGNLARAFGLEPAKPRRSPPGQGRSFFLADLLQSVIFGEAMLASDPPGRARRRLARSAAWAGLAGAVLASCAGLLGAGAVATARLDAEAAVLAPYEQAQAALTLDPVADADLPHLAPLLDAARAAAAVPDRPDRWEWGLRALGLSQHAKIAAGRRALYRHALDYALLPRLLWRLETQLRGSLDRPDFAYEATRIYLMLGNLGPLDRDLVRAWMALDWGMPGGGDAALRRGLAGHLDALLAAPLPAVALDGDLIAQARAAFGKVSLAQRAYSRIRPSPAAGRVPPWRPSEALGPAGVRVFVRNSGRRLDDGVPGFFTVAGFRSVLLPALDGAVREVAAEAWVADQPTAPVADAASRAVQREVVALYGAEYAQHWDAMLDDLEVAPLRSLTQAAQDLFILASPHSPMRALLVSASRQLTLADPPVTAPQPTAAASRLRDLFPTSPEAATAPERPGHEIDERYAALRELVGHGADAPIDPVLKSLVDLQQQLAKMAAASHATAALGGVDPVLALQAEAQQQPKPLSRWLAAIAASGAALRGGGPRQQIVTAYNAPGGPGPVCSALVAGAFPFAPNATGETSLDDFARLFGPGGLLDGFFNTQLRPYVDMTGQVWRAQAVDGSPPPVSPADLAQFQRAAQIRDAFFPEGGSRPKLRFEATLSAMDPAAQRATVAIADVTLASRRGEPPRPAQITWPAPATAAATATLAFEPPAAAGPLQVTGQWPLLRLLGRFRLQPAGASEHYTVVLRDGARSATLELRLGGAPNVFTPGLLSDFRCPAVR